MYRKIRVWRSNSWHSWQRSRSLDCFARSFTVVGSVNGVVPILDPAGSQGAIVSSTVPTMGCPSTTSSASRALFARTVVSTSNESFKSGISSPSTGIYKRASQREVWCQLGAQRRVKIQIDVGTIAWDFLMHLQGSKSSAVSHESFMFWIVHLPCMASEVVQANHGERFFAGGVLGAYCIVEGSVLITNRFTWVLWLFL